jgi:hypothetical protein
MEYVEKRKFLTLPGLELQLLGRPARKPLVTPTALSRFLMETSSKSNLQKRAKKRSRVFPRNNLGWTYSVPSRPFHDHSYIKPML